jgi:hypothetical protein
VSAGNRPARVTIPLAVTALAVAVHAGALPTYFAQDDITFLFRAAHHIPHPGLTRLLSAGLAISLEHGVFGLSPLGYHVVNLALHALNTLGVHALALRWTRSSSSAWLAAIGFGTSSIAFTPLHWVTGIVELLTTALLLGATLIHLRPGAAGPWRVVGALLLLVAALLSKEAAIPWVGVMVAVGALSGQGRTALRALLPAGVLTIAFIGYLVAGGIALDTARHGAYALTLSPEFLTANLATYIAWNLAAWNPIPDQAAVADAGAWHVAAPLCVIIAFVIGRLPAPRRLPFYMGLFWWLAFLLPVLLLEHHTYYYYLYVPWVGGSIALAALLTGALETWNARRAPMVCAAAATIAVALQWRDIAYRSSAVHDALPVDRTLRDALLTRHAVLGLRAASLPEGTPVGFVNPVPRAATGPTRTRVSFEAPAGDADAYVPLEAALRGGETLALLVPEVRYRGFATTIPYDWLDVECFYYEQRGWLERWGKGAQALRGQARVQRAAGQGLAADSTDRRIRALGDSLADPGARRLTASSRSR